MQTGERAHLMTARDLVNLLQKANKKINNDNKSSQVAADDNEKPNLWEEIMESKTTLNSIMMESHLNIIQRP